MSNTRLNGIEYLFYCEREDEVLDFIYKLMQRLQASGPGPGYNPKIWGHFVKYLGALGDFQGDGSILDHLKAMDPPSGHSSWEWSSFLWIVRREFTSLHEENTEKTSFLLKETPKWESNSSIPDMLRKAEHSLTIPCQPDEASSMEGQQINATQRVRNPPVVNNVTSTSSSSRTNNPEEELRERRE